MQINEIKTGDTLLVSDKKSFVSRSIIYFMKKWAKKQDIKYDYVLSHAAHFAWIADTLYVYGSIDSGYKPWEFNKHYSLNDPNKPCVIQRRKTPLTKEEENKTIRYCQHLVTVSLMYEYWALIKWILLIWFNWDTFKKDSDDFTYCYEGEYKCRKNLNPENYSEKDYRVDFFMLSNDCTREVIYKNI